MKNRLPVLAAVAGVLSLMVVDAAEARRGGSFGSRGMRTYSAPPPTRTAPTQAQPIQRSMTPQQPAAAARTPATAGVRTPPRAGLFSNPLVRGLLLGGLLGALLGFGFGGMGGMLSALIQVAVIALVAMLLLRLFARRKQPAPATATAGYRSNFEMQPPATPAGPDRYFKGVPTAAPAALDPTDEVGVTQADLDAFERLLGEIQQAFGSEDYGTLRSLTTPEIMSYLSEELSQNAVAGRRNQVSDVRLIQGDLAEAWREGDTDYATVAMRYESRDVVLDRSTGQVVAGDRELPTETTELWTFSRANGSPWKLSAIQEA